MTHPGAIYLHEAQSYFVNELNLEEHIARLRPIESDYYTESLRGTEITVLSETAQAAVLGGDKSWGELQVTTQVTGFRKRRWYTHENLGEEPLDLPPSDLQTTGYWLSLSEETVAHLREAGAWTNDPNNYGPEWARIRDRVRARDGYKCQVCGTPESTRQHDVHHKTPFRAFISIGRSKSTGKSNNALSILPSQSGTERPHAQRACRAGLCARKSRAIIFDV